MITILTLLLPSAFRQATETQGKSIDGGAAGGGNIVKNYTDYWLLDNRLKVEGDVWLGLVLVTACDRTPLR